MKEGFGFPSFNNMSLNFQNLIKIEKNTKAIVVKIK